jgi:hypothetical protein
MLQLDGESERGGDGGEGREDLKDEIVKLVGRWLWVAQWIGRE